MFSVLFAETRKAITYYVLKNSVKGLSSAFEKSQPLFQTII